MKTAWIKPKRVPAIALGAAAGLLLLACARPAAAWIESGGWGDSGYGYYDDHYEESQAWAEEQAREAELPLRILRWRSSDSYNGWQVPENWHVRKAELRRDGRVVFDGRSHTLGVARYAKSFQGKLDWEALRPRLVTDPGLPEAYVFHCVWQYRPWAADWARAPTASASSSAASRSSRRPSTRGDGSWMTDGCGKPLGLGSALRGRPRSTLGASSHPIEAQSRVSVPARRRRWS